MPCSRVESSRYYEPSVVDSEGNCAVHSVATFQGVVRGNTLFQPSGVRRSSTILPYSSVSMFAILKFLSTGLSTDLSTDLSTTRL